MSDPCRDVPGRDRLGRQHVSGSGAEIAKRESGVMSLGALTEDGVTRAELMVISLENDALNVSQLNATIDEALQVLPGSISQRAAETLL